MEVSPAIPKLSCGISSLLVIFLGLGRSFAESDVKAHSFFLLVTVDVWVFTGLLVVGHHLYPGFAFMNASLYYKRKGKLPVMTLHYPQGNTVHCV